MTIRENIAEIVADMTGPQKIVIALVIVAIAGVLLFGGSAISGFKIKKLEKEVIAAKDNAQRWEELAVTRELEAAQYKQKTEFLESNLGEIQKIARTQDENLEKFRSVSANARADVERARGISSIASTAEDLCRRLGEVGHPCG